MRVFLLCHARPVRCVILIVALLTLREMTVASACAAEAGGGAAREAALQVYRDKVEPHWFDGNRKFWYRVQTGRDRYEFILVDAEAGTRRAAFDHQRLAGLLGEAGVKGVEAENLKLDDLEMEAGGAITFVAGGKGWRWQPGAGDLAETVLTNRAGLAALPATAPRASRRTGEETSITFLNLTSGEIGLFWLDAEGERQPYGKVAPGERRDQHTFAGHVWVATDEQGATLGTWEAQEEHATIEVNGRKTEPVPAPRPERRGRSRPPAESPNGLWRVFFTNDNVGVTQVESGRRVMLTTNGTAEDGYAGSAYWSPDSSRLVAMRTRKGDDRKVYLVESSPKDQLQPKLQSYDYLKPGDKVAVSRPHLFEVSSGREIEVKDDLCPNPWSIGELRWSPDSSRFTFLYNQRGHQLLRLIAVDAKTGEARAIVEEQSPTFIDYSGKYFAELVYGKGEPAPLDIIWMSERDGWNHLYLYDGMTGRVKNQVTRGEWVVRGVERVDAESRQVWFRAGGIRAGQDLYYVHYCRVNFDGTGLTVLTEGDGTHRARFSPDRRFFIDTWSRVDLAPINELRRAEDGKLVCRLEEADASELTAAGRRFPERFVAKGRDGRTDIFGVIHWPEGMAAGGRYPVIESIYAGPQGAFVPKAFSVGQRTRELGRRGFIVVQIDGMGTSERSKAFHDVCWKNLGDAGFPDRILWLKAAAVAHPEMDLSRLGIYGTSAGGQSALRALLAHGDFYKAAVADCGCHDNRMDKIWWNEQWMGWPVGPQYEEQSNVTQAHELHGKLLLMVGELDKNVDPASTMQVVNALIKADKDFELLVMPGAGHGVLGTPYAQRRMVDFFQRNL